MLDMVIEWKNVPNTNGAYQVSNIGTIRSVERTITYKDGRTRVCPEKLLHLPLNSDGYPQVCLYILGERKTLKVHRLVVQAFLPNPDNLPEVNHKDENKTNNTVWLNPDGTVDLEKSNLEWCTTNYNHNYGTRNNRAAKAMMGHIVSSETRNKIAETKLKPVDQYLKNGTLIKNYSSIKEVHNTLGYSISCISRVCNGEREQAYGYIWRFA